MTNPESLKAAQGWIEELDKQRQLANCARTGATKNSAPSIERPPTILVGNKIDSPSPPRFISFSEGSDVAYELEIDYYETCAMPEIKYMDGDEDGYEEPSKGKNVMGEDEMNDSANPRTVIMNLLTQIVRKIPPSVVTVRDLPEGISQESVGLLFVPAETFINLNMRVHRPLYLDLPVRIRIDRRTMVSARGGVTNLMGGSDNLRLSTQTENFTLGDTLPGQQAECADILICGDDGRFIFPIVSKDINISIMSIFMNEITPMEELEEINNKTDNSNSVNLEARLRYEKMWDKEDPRHFVATTECDWMA